jgi:uncharacterized protein (DUF433 family)
MSTPLSTLESNDVAKLSRYVARDPEQWQGEPIVAGTQVAVRDIVMLWQTGVAPEDIPETLFDLVTIAQVFDVLSFYLDNRLEIDERIEWYKVHQLPQALSPAFKYNPLWNDVEESIAAGRQELSENSL